MVILVYTSIYQCYQGRYQDNHLLMTESVSSRIEWKYSFFMLLHVILQSGQILLYQSDLSKR